MGEIVCADCHCGLYSTGEDGANGTTGELCGSCQAKRQHEENLDYDEDDWDD